jgi:YVTN family beta-propeller protein
VEFRVLGPLEVVVGGRELALGGPKQRALLAMLVLHRNEAVARDRLIEAVWGDSPPDSASRALDTYISRLRAQLGAERVIRQAPGHLLRVEPGELDLERYDGLVADAASLREQGDAAGAARELREALALWRGPALADLRYEPGVSRLADGLEERRLHALEQRLDADLARGDSATLVAELHQLVRSHPSRERLVGQLALALYRAGRQADALASLAETRQHLARELGLAPGPALRELERQILQHDSALDLPVRAATGLQRRSRRIALVGVAAVAIIAAGIAVAVSAQSGHDARRPVAETSSRLLSFGVHSGSAQQQALLSAVASAVAAGGGAVWVAEPNTHDVLRIDQATGSVVDRIPVRGQPSGIAIDGGSVWVASTLTGTLSRIAVDTGTVTQTISLGGADATAVAVGKAGLWVADSTDGALLQIDRETGETLRTVTLGGSPTALAVTASAIWVADHDAGQVSEIDASSGRRLATADVGGGPAAIAVGPGAVWVANSLDATAARIDPETGAVVAVVAVGSDPSGITVAGGSVWVANQYSGTLTRIDARTNRITATIPTGGQPAAIGASGASLWVGAGPAPHTHRGGTLVLATTARFPSIDPAFQNTASPNQFGKLAYDTLVTFEATGGSAALRLVPDLAIALPPPTNGGTEYTFRLRPGIHYSDGRLLRASDFRRGIERLFRVGSQGSDYFSGLVGGARCTRTPKTCTLADGIHTDDAAGTVEFRLTTSDPDFLYKLTSYSYAVPIPPGIPDRDVGASPVPGTGPYRLLPRLPGAQITFERNPYFREWSHAAQPNGNPDAIVWHTYPSIDAEVRAVRLGRADWIYGILPPRELPRLRIAVPAQLHDNATFIVDFVPLNTHLAPFDDVRVRRALNLAIDRRKIVALYGGPTAATPICQPLPAGFLGYRRYCPYTARPNPDGVWRAPDLARARRLVAASGTRGETIDVWGTSDNLGVPRGLPAYIASVLRSLGYHTRLHLRPGARISYALRRTFQLSVDGDWAPDYPSPSALLPPFFACGGGYTNGYVCDRGLDRAMQRASAAELRDPDAASALWAKADKMIVDRAYWVPTVSSHAPELVSRRLGNYEYSPIWDFVADQAWLR